MTDDSLPIDTSNTSDTSDLNDPGDPGDPGDPQRRYQALEKDTPEVLQWQTDQDRVARDALHGSPCFESFEALLRPAFADVLSFHAPRKVQGTWFARVVPPGATQPVVTVAEAAADGAVGEARVIFDLASLGQPDALLQDLQPSPDGKRVLLIIGSGDGSMRTTVRIIDAQKEPTAACRDFTVIGPVSMPVWKPDGSGFLYTGLPLGVDPASLPPAPGLRIFEQLLDDALTRTVLPLHHDHPVVAARVSTDGRYAFLNEGQGAVHPAYLRRLEVSRAPTDVDGPSQWVRSGAWGDAQGWVPFLDESHGRVKGTIVGDAFIAVTNDGAPRGRLVSIPLASARDHATWRELLPEGEAVLVSVTPAGGRLVLGESFEGRARLRVLSMEGRVEGIVPIDPDGAVGKFAFGFVTGLIDDLVWAGGDDLSFVYSSLTQPPVAYRYDVVAERLDAFQPASARLDGLTLTAARTPGLPAVALLAGPSSDSSAPAVTYRVMSGDDGTDPRPTIVTGYGGFNVHWLPCWSNLAAAWVKAGGRWVHAHLRGGGEFGDDFWQDGRMARKSHGFEDLFAVIDDLTRRGLCTAEQLGVFGASNGALLVGAAIAFRPASIAAGVAQVPIVDVLGCARDPGTLTIVRSEFGDPLAEEDALWMRAWSPFHHLPTGQRLPALLADAGLQDTTCPPWHARKLVAAVRAKGAEGSGPVLLRVREGVAHNVTNAALAIERDAETLSFFARQLGLAP
ncbi:prolyl oligopeptidase family serine peptidase [Mitsuaria sp. 7]|uniref:prolyl oligopeptidase family serine peptidase n=1 Tax=Mitsuaria sp. 7 TaxID=1658665 RepID=UPI0007DCE236|nr:prolyl oligopeptidase family serine peptidase [Mitsuaria sp. 7]ANH67081.1 hypothetical protein ABE85_04950 [Mitsuaria sp. 7]